MENFNDANNMLSVLASLMPPNPDDVARKLASDFRRRRVEKSLTRDDVARLSGVAPANIARFEQKALISLGNFIRLAIALGYPREIEQVLATPKYQTMEELTQIHKNSKKTKAYHRKPKPKG